MFNVIDLEVEVREKKYKRKRKKAENNMAPSSPRLSCCRCSCRRHRLLPCRRRAHLYHSRVVVKSQMRGSQRESFFLPPTMSHACILHDQNDAGARNTRSLTRLGSPFPAFLLLLRIRLVKWPWIHHAKLMCSSCSCHWRLPHHCYPRWMSCPWAPVHMKS